MKEKKLAKIVELCSESLYAFLKDSFYGKMRRGKPLASIPSDTGQRGQMLGQLFEDVVDERLEEYCKNENIPYERIDNSVGDFLIDGVPWELKTKFVDRNSETYINKKGEITYIYTGSTHSASKCNNYILFGMALDIDRPLSLEDEENKGIFNLDSRFLIVGKNIGKYLQWHGKATKSNSRTALKISIKDAAKVEKHCYFGRVVPTRKWAHCRNEIE
tara:strand:- start:10 stop:660 length:651 start_codon:yes stop_codon:yes gene_type:complete